MTASVWSCGWAKALVAAAAFAAALSLQPAVSAAKDAADRNANQPESESHAQPERPADKDTGKSDSQQDNQAGKKDSQSDKKVADEQGKEAETPKTQPKTPAGKDSGKSDGQKNNQADEKGDQSDKKRADEQGKEAETPAKAEAGDKPADSCDQEKLLIKSDYRQQLCKAGLKLGVTETSEVLGNLTGGRHQGAIYEGLTDLNLDIDFRPTLHIRGDLFARAYQIHGRGLTPTIGSLNEMSGIEAAPTTRLVELWYEQRFDHWLRIRIGQQTIGNEFFNPESSRLFVNGTFGWPTQPSLDLPSGGPGFPLGTPAIRVRIDPMEGLTLFTAVFNGDPTGAGVGGSQLADASGTAFRTSDGAWAIAEIRYNPDDSDKNGTYRLGTWYNSERFRDLRFDTNGNSLAGPQSNGHPRLHDGDYTLYVNVDQPLLVNEDAHTRLGLFARAGVVPGDRNLIDVYADGGIIYGGPFGRANDRIGLALAYAKVSGAARGFDADVVKFNGSPFPIRSAETILEVTYQFQLTPWWQLQPDFQYVFNPGGGVPSLTTSTRRVGDAVVLGLRTAITF